MTDRLCVEGVVKLRVDRGRGRCMYCCSTAAEPRVLRFHRAPRAWRHGVPPGVDARACVGRAQHVLDLRTVHTLDVVECVNAAWAVGEDSVARAEFVLRAAGGRVWALTVDGCDAVRVWRRALGRLLAKAAPVPAPAPVPSASVRSRATSVAAPRSVPVPVPPPAPCSSQAPAVVPVASATTTAATTTATTTTMTGTRPRAQTLDLQRIMAVLDTLMPKTGACTPPCTPCTSISSRTGSKRGAPAVACDTDDGGCSCSTAEMLSPLDVRDECLAPPAVPATTAVVHADAHTPCAAAVQRIVHSPMMAVLPPLFPLPALPPIMSAPADSACFSPPATAPASPVVVLPSQ